MGSGVGPRIQGHDSLSVKVDAGNIISSTGSGASVKLYIFIKLDHNK